MEMAIIKMMGITFKWVILRHFCHFELKLKEGPFQILLTHSYSYVQAKGEQVVEAKVVGDDLRHWKGKIFGPVSTFIFSI